MSTLTRSGDIPVARRIRREPIKWRRGSHVTPRVPIAGINIEVQAQFDLAGDKVRSAWYHARSLEPKDTGAPSPDYRIAVAMARAAEDVQSALHHELDSRVEIFPGNWLRVIEDDDGDYITVCTAVEILASVERRYLTFYR